MQLLGGDADFGAQAQFSPVNEARRGIDKHGGRIHAAHPGIGVFSVLGDDRLAVPGPVRRDVLDRLIQ